LILKIWLLKKQAVSKAIILRKESEVLLIFTTENQQIATSFLIAMTAKIHF